MTHFLKVALLVAALARGTPAQQPPCAEFFEQWHSGYHQSYSTFRWHSTQLRWFEYVELVPVGTGIGAIVMWRHLPSLWYPEPTVSYYPFHPCEQRQLQVTGFWWMDGWPHAPGDRMRYLGLDVDLVAVPTGLVLMPPQRAQSEPFCQRSGINSEWHRPWYWALLLVPEGGTW